MSSPAHLQFRHFLPEMNPLWPRLYFISSQTLHDERLTAVEGGSKGGSDKRHHEEYCFEAHIDPS